MRDTGMRNERELYRMRIENIDWTNKVICSGQQDGQRANNGPNERQGDNDNPDMYLWIDPGWPARLLMLSALPAFIAEAAAINGLGRLGISQVSSSWCNASATCCLVLLRRLADRSQETQAPVQPGVTSMPLSPATHEQGLGHLRTTAGQTKSPESVILSESESRGRGMRKSRRIPTVSPSPCCCREFSPRCLVKTP
jgi:hypothetical protein